MLRPNEEEAPGPSRAPGIWRSSMLLALALALTTVGFAPSASIAGETWASPGIPWDEADQSGFPAATYFRATRLDMRLCPAPTCGGLFVERVNRRRTLCADGEYAAECHALAVDFSALRLSPEEEVQLRADFTAKRVLARGALELVEVAAGVEVPTLVVTDAWRGVTGTMSGRGRFWGVVPTGIVCITYPCPTLMRLKLNGRRVGWLHGLDLSESGATPEEIGDAINDLHQGPGLLVFGGKRRIVGPAGKGIELVGSEFFRKVEP